MVASWWRGRPQRPDLVDGGRENDLERPSEDRAFRWVEVAFVDPEKIDHDAGAADGVGAAANAPNAVNSSSDAGASDGGAHPAIPMFRATSETGHVVAVELALAQGNPVMWIQDDLSEADGVGGRVLSVSLTPTQAKDSRVVVSRGVGHALFDYLPTSNDGPSAFVAFSDVAEHPMLVDVMSSGAPGFDPRPTLEATMDLGRPLLVLPAPAAAASGAGVPGATGARILALKVPSLANNGASAPAELWILSCGQ